jgi:hypothetical protein
VIANSDTEFSMLGIEEVDNAALALTETFCKSPARSSFFLPPSPAAVPIPRRLSTNVSALNLRKAKRFFGVLVRLET